VDIELDSGDVIVDVNTKETGLLVRRYNIFEHAEDPIYAPLAAWEIVWSGTQVRAGRLHSFTEESIKNMIRASALLLIKNN